MLVLDTSVVSALMHRRRHDLAQLARHTPGEVVLTAPVLAELRFGLERLPEGSRRRVVLTGELSRLRRVIAWSDWTEAAACEFGRQKARLQSLGTPVDDMDVAIGALAICLGARLATYNVRHFERFEGLTLDPWGH